ncbi:4586_t:CDS:2 [Dentiscutata erythropus]|uniref:4586_t:CDS:1 n=1 Tax=Dentiscutata erythropus TaxID=1348616 RepID=A0A9N9GQ47_9GLOM|nr:4586_t:CDS:2 [Dentiscutata erythropus]
MDYSVLKTLAKEVGMSVPSDAFRKTSFGSSSSTPTKERFSKCSNCGGPRTPFGWCKPCDTKKLKENFGNWTSGNDDLDNFIRETQMNASTPYDYMKWIPFENFSDLKFVAKGGFGSVFSAQSNGLGKVALKFLDNSENLTKDFLNELRAHHRCSLVSNGIVDCFGVSKDPKTNRYVMVLRYAEQRDLRLYLTQYFAELSWDRKIELFDLIAKGLQEIHSHGYVHRDFHRAHDYSLARDICLGLRPPIISGTPKGYVAAMLRCWDAEPSKRPTIEELLNASFKWRYLSDGNAPFQGPKTKKVPTGNISRPTTTCSNASHPQAFYTSRLLHFPNLPEPKNLDYYTLFDSTTGEIHKIVRKNTSKKESIRSSNPPMKEYSRQITADKDNEVAKEPRSSTSLTRSITIGRMVDQSTIDKIRAERRRLSKYRSTYLEDIPNQVELSTVTNKLDKLQLKKN